VTAAAITVHSPEGAPWEFLALFLVVIIGPPLMRRARVPGIIGLLLGGFLIGPHGLGWIAAGDTTVPELGQIGLLYLMFVAGVELDLALLRVHRHTALIFSLATFSVPMTLGTVVGLALGWPVAAALLLGSLLASHTLLTYPVARGAGLTGDPAVASAVGATVLTDTLALIVLAGVSGAETQGGTAADVVLQIVLGLAVLLAFSMLALPWLARLAFRHLGTDRTVRYVLAVAAFLAAATLAESFGIEGIVGAFFAGLALNRLVPNEGPLMERIDFFGAAVFIPVFLVSVGLLLEPSVMIEGETLGLAALFIVACIGGKAIAAWCAGRGLGFSRPQVAMMFGLTAPQAAATLAATVVGFNIGLFSESVVNAVLVLILVSIVVATLVVERAKDRVAPPARVDRRLGERILVALQDPLQAPLAFAIAARVAAPDGGVVRGLLCTPGALPDENRVLGQINAAGIAAGVDTEPHLLVARSLADGIVDAAIAEHASLVLIGDVDGGAASALGTLAESVAAAAPVPVAVVRGAAPLADVHLVRPEGDDPRSTLAAELAVRVGGAEVPVREQRSPDGVAIVAVASWDLMGDVPAPALLVLTPSAPSEPSPSVTRDRTGAP
jgi:Kef-type K+ transport system membrane component KefB